MAQAYYVEAIALEKQQAGELVCCGLAYNGTLQQAQALIDAKLGPGRYRVSQPPPGAIFAVQKVETQEIGDAVLDSVDDGETDDAGDIEVVAG